jgi:hypothetical protein
LFGKLESSVSLTPNLLTAAAICQRRVKAVSTHYMATVRVAAVRRRLLHRGSPDDRHIDSHSENAQITNRACKQRPIKRSPASHGPLVALARLVETWV